MNKLSKKSVKLINIIDVEATCGEEVNTLEIIQIGICVVNTSERIIQDEKRIYLKPRHSVVTKFCTELTGITSDDVADADIYERVMPVLFEEYKLSRRPWVSWGDYDREVFVQMGKLYNDRYYFGKTHINLKNIFAIFRGMSREVGLKSAIDQLGLTFQGSQHDGLDDAVNIAKILLEMIQQQ